MSKFFTIVVSLFISWPAFSAPNSCLEGIIQAEDLLRGLTSRQIECVARAAGTKESLQGLCSSDLEQFSVSYTTYLKYEVAYKDAFRRLQTATDDASKVAAANIDIQNIDSEWKAIGFKNEMRSLLWPLIQAKSNCKGR